MLYVEIDFGLGIILILGIVKEVVVLGIVC